MLFLDRHGFAGERGFFDLQIDGFDQPRIGGDFVAGTQQDDIAGDERARGILCSSPSRNTVAWARPSGAALRWRAPPGIPAQSPTTPQTAR